MTTERDDTPEARLAAREPSEPGSLRFWADGSCAGPTVYFGSPSAGADYDTEAVCGWDDDDEDAELNAENAAARLNEIIGPLLPHPAAPAPADEREDLLAALGELFAAFGISGVTICGVDPGFGLPDGAKIISYAAKVARDARHRGPDPEVRHCGHCGRDVGDEGITVCPACAVGCGPDPEAA